MNAEEEKALRAKIAYDIRAELVCCDMYDTVQKVAEALEANGQVMWNPADHIRSYHDICHWGEAAARIAEGQPEFVPDGLCANKDDHEPHEHESPTLGKFWCTANQTSRLPYAAEVRRINGE